MDYAKFKATGKLISLEPTGFKKPYQKLFDQTNASGHEGFTLYSHNNFSNSLQQADEALYEKMGYWAEIFHDIVRNGGKGTDDKGRLHVQYVANAGTNEEKTHHVRAPPNGFYYPVDECFFHEGTLIPLATTKSKDEAVREFTNYAIKKLGLSRKEAGDLANREVSRFYRLDNYNSDRFVGRYFGPSWGDYGKFDIVAAGLPSGSGSGRVASRRVGLGIKFLNRIVMEINK